MTPCSPHAHFKQRVASCASLHSIPHTLAPHFRHLIFPQYPQLSQKCRCGGPPAGGGATCEAAYDSGGAASSASSSAWLTGGGIWVSMASRGSSSRPMREAGFVSVGAGGAGVASEGVGGTEATVLERRSGWAARRDAVVAARGRGACCARASCASSSSSQCLIWRWYCMIRRAFCVLGMAGSAG